jgi:hypothetical protein
MGFWGAVLVARTDVPLTGLRSVRALGGEADREEPGLAGWRWLTLIGPEREDDAAVQAIADEVGGPALVAFVFDSDTAAVRLAAPRRGLLRRAPRMVRFFLDEESARDYELPVDTAEQAAAADSVVAWAGAGDVDAVRAAITRDAVFAEEAVLALAVAFGAIARDALPDEAFEDASDDDLDDD